MKFILYLIISVSSVVASASSFNSIMKPHGNLQAKDFDLVKFTVNNEEQLVAFGWEFSTNSFVGYNINGIGEIDSNHRISVYFDVVETGETRWAPSVTVQEGVLYMYYARGANQLAGMQIYVATVNLDNPNEVTYYDSGRISSITFHQEDRLPLMEFNDFAGRSFDQNDPYSAGIIDPEIFVDDNGNLFLYYVVVLPGIPNSACHEEFIRVQKMTNFTTPKGQEFDMPIVDGFCNATYDGVVESPSVVKINASYRLTFSSYPSSWIYPSGVNTNAGQFVKIVDLATPTTPGVNERPLFANENQTLTNGLLINPTYELDNSVSQHGFGGQDVVNLGNGHFKLIGQGLYDISGQQAPREFGIFTNDIETSIFLNIQ